METLSTDEKLKKVTATYATKNTAELLGRVEFGKEVIIIEKHNRPSVAMIPYEEYFSNDHLLLSKKDRDLFLSALDRSPAPNAPLRKAMKAFQKKHG